MEERRGRNSFAESFMSSSSLFLFFWETVLGESKREEECVRVSTIQYKWYIHTHIVFQ